jgi:hypothetical protein
MALLNFQIMNFTVYMICIPSLLAQHIIINANFCHKTFTENTCITFTNYVGLSLNPVFFCKAVNIRNCTAFVISHIKIRYGFLGYENMYFGRQAGSFGMMAPSTKRHSITSLNRGILTLTSIRTPYLLLKCLTQFDKIVFGHSS